MGTDLQKGTTYHEGDQVNAANLNAHVDNAIIKYTAISGRTLKDPAALGDELLINDNGVLKKITLQQISSLVVIPPGTVNDFAGTTEPTGWLFCYGQLVSRTTYTALFQAIGVTYSAGDGSTTFGIPDCRGRVAAGKDNMGGSSSDRLSTIIDGDILGAAGGIDRHTLTVNEMPSHLHTVGSNNFLFAPGVGGAYSVTTAPGLAEWGGGSTGGGFPHTNLQPTIVFNKIIKI